MSQTVSGALLQVAAPPEEEYDVGIIVARFQVPDLTEGHRQLIETVCANHDKVVVFLGLSPLVTTANNPLDFEARKQMLLTAYPKLNVLYIADEPEDVAWSRKLDKMVTELTTPQQKAILYGSRDSFMAHYSGRLPTRELVQDVYTSGSALRRDVARKSVRATAEFRAGATWAAASKYPTCFPTVDVAIFNEGYTQLLVARKENETAFRLVGGFADPRSESYEADAAREATEETGLQLGDIRYVTSKIVDDWRYRNEVDKIKTLLFTAKKLWGSPKAQDDIYELRWVDVSTNSAGTPYISLPIVAEHKELVTAALLATQTERNA